MGISRVGNLNWTASILSLPTNYVRTNFTRAIPRAVSQTQTDLSTRQIMYANNAQSMKRRPDPIWPESKSVSPAYSLSSSKLNLSPRPQLSVIILPLPPEPLLVHSPSILPQSFNPLPLLRCRSVISTDIPLCSRLQHPVAR